MSSFIPFVRKTTQTATTIRDDCFSLLPFLSFSVCFPEPSRRFQSPLLAQAISGDLVGAVLDAAGAPVPAASITLTNPETGLKAVTTVNRRGEYRFTDLPSGEYKLAATAPRFAQTTVAGIDIRLNATATANITLGVATLATSIDVVEGRPETDTSSAQIRSSYGEKLAEDLPLASIGLGVVNFSLLSAGVGSSGGIGVGSGPSVGGQRPRNNNFTVDGVDNNSKQSTGPTVAIPNDSVAEFSLLQNQFLAEFGHSSGGQFNTVVKSGTNELRGTVYDIWRTAAECGGSVVR